MGIYDRDYYRRSGPSFLASFTERGQVCKWLIAINVALFVIQLLTTQKVAVVNEYGEPIAVRRVAGPVTDALILDPQAVVHGQVWRLLTYAFLHDPASLWHIIINMLFLWWFGSDVEDLYGPREFLAFYLVSALAGGIVYTVWGLAEDGARCLGASGAVTAVLVLAALHFPTRIILVSFFLPVPIWLFVVFQVAKDAFTFLSHEETAVAVVVHLAGAAFAFVYYKSNWRLLNVLPNLRSLQRARSGPRLRVYREEAPQPVPVAAPPPPSAAGAEVDEQLEAKMDAVLEKVKRSGMASLTENEKQILFRASEVLRRRKS